MRTKPVALGVVVLAVLFFISVGFIVFRPSSPALTVRYVKSVHTGDGIGATFEFSNRTANTYLLNENSVEVRKGSPWHELYHV